MCSAFQKPARIAPIAWGAANSQLGEQKAQSCDNACYQQLPKNKPERITPPRLNLGQLPRQLFWSRGSEAGKGIPVHPAHV
jgi:hypothetical protein